VPHSGSLQIRGHSERRKWIGVWCYINNLKITFILSITTEILKNKKTRKSPVKKLKQRSNLIMELIKYKDLLSVDDLMKIFNVSKATIYKEIKQGKFGIPIQIGRAYKIPKNYVLKKFFSDYT
jgi:predicted DNA-binding transcriptional regulator AlpA